MERLASENGLERVNLTDSDAKFVKSRQGVIAGDNVQTVVSPLKVTETDKTGGMFVTAMMQYKMLKIITNW